MSPRELPPLSALRAFEAAARHASFHFACAPELVARADIVALRTWFQDRMAAT